MTRKYSSTIALQVPAKLANHEKIKTGVAYKVVRPRHYEEAFEGWMPEIVAGCHGRTFIFDNPAAAQELADLLNSCSSPPWQVQATDSLPEGEVCDAYDLDKYKSNVREAIAQTSWFQTESEIGYVLLAYIVGEYASLDVEGTVTIQLLTPYDEPLNGCRSYYTREVAEELTQYLDIRNHIAVDGRSPISIATGRCVFLEENLCGSPEAEAGAGSVVE